MSEQLEMTLFLIDRLESAGIPYMLTGSVAMSTYIVPRMTMDVDLVVECDQTRPADWVALFGEDCYISLEAVRDAQARGGMFNIIHNQLIAKADIIVRRSSEYRKLEFSRRQVRTLAERDVYVVSPEDLHRGRPAMGANQVMSLDTPPEVEAQYNRMIMELSPEERMLRCFRMFDQAKALAQAGLEAEPNPRNLSMRARIFLRFYGTEYSEEEQARIIRAIDTAAPR
jgi:hypothetical protein